MDTSIKELTALVNKAIDRRVCILENLAEVLLNDLQVAQYRLKLDNGRADLNDIRVGGWHRASTEYAALKWFRDMMETESINDLGVLRERICEALKERLETMSVAKTQLNNDVGLVMRRVKGSALSRDWADLRTGAWYRSSTESRVYSWLLGAVATILAGCEPVELDALDETVDLDEDEVEPPSSVGRAAGATARASRS